MIEWKRVIIDNTDATATAERETVYKSVPQIVRNFPSIVTNYVTESNKNKSNDTLTTSDELYFKNTFRSTYVYDNTYISSSATTTPGSFSLASSKKLYIDAVSIGDVDIVRFSINETATVYSSFIFDHTKNIDDNSDVVLTWINDKTMAAYTNGNSTMLSTSNFESATKSIKYDTSSPVYYISEARNYSQKRILQPLYFHGVKSNLWSIDGGTNSPSDFTQFVIDGHTFLCVGIGLAVKVL